MNRTTFALTATMIVSAFAMEAAANQNYYNKNAHGYNKKPAKQYERSANMDHYDKQGRYYRHADAATGCIEPVSLDNTELQKIRAKNPGMDICYTDVN